MLNLLFALSLWLPAITLYNALLGYGRITSFNHCSLRLTLWLKGHWLNRPLVLSVSQHLLSLPAFYGIRDFVDFSYCLERKVLGGWCTVCNRGVLLLLPGVLPEKAVFVKKSTLDLRLQIWPKLSLHFWNFMCVVFYCKMDLNRDNLVRKIWYLQCLFLPMYVGQLYLKAQDCLSAYWENIWRQQCFLQGNMLAFGMDLASVLSPDPQWLYAVMLQCSWSVPLSESYAAVILLFFIQWGKNNVEYTQIWAFHHQETCS